MPFALHFRDRRIRDLIDETIRVRSNPRLTRRHRPHRGVAGVHRDRKFLRVRFIDDRAQDVEVHAIEGVTRHTCFEDSLDRIDFARASSSTCLRASSGVFGMRRNWASKPARAFPA